MRALDRFVTVKTFTYPLEVAVIRGRLEAEGIECFAQDELTAQVNPFYSNAIGGVKLQVREHDLRKAIEILEETGYLKEADFRPTPLYTALDNATFKIPVLRNMQLEFRLMVIVAVVVTVFMVVLWVGMQR